MSENVKYFIIKLAGAIAAAPLVAWAFEFFFVNKQPFWGFLLLYLAACAWGVVAAFFVFIVWPDKPKEDEF